MKLNWRMLEIPLGDPSRNQVRFPSLCPSSFPCLTSVPPPASLDLFDFDLIILLI